LIDKTSGFCRILYINPVVVIPWCCFFCHRNLLLSTLRQPHHDLGCVGED